QTRTRSETRSCIYDAQDLVLRASPSPRLYIPTRRHIVLRSALETGCSVWSLRLCFLDFWWRRWLIQELRRTSLPFRVTRTRLAMPFWVLILGTGRLGLLRCRLTARRQDHEEVSTLEQRLAL